MRSLIPTLLLIALPWTLPAADDLDRLLAAAPVPAAYTNEKPVFAVAKEQHAQATATGETTKEYWVVRDRGRAVAVLNEADCQLDWITPRPDLAKAELVLPKVYSWVSLLGCRISTVAWIDGQGASGDTRSHTFNAGGDTIVLTVNETWTKKRQGDSSYVFTLRLDPVLGYVWDIRTRISVDRLEEKKDKKLQRDVELLNVQPGQLSDPWPDRWRYDRTVISLAGEDGFLGFANNLVAGDRSDNGGRLKQRNGGLTAFVADKDGWGMALVRSDTGTAEQAPNATCNVWLDQHNKLQFPEQAGSDGNRVIDATWRWAGMPPQAVAELAKKTRLIDFGEKAVMVRLGVDEHFDDQPLALDTPQRGMWTWGLEVNGEHARSGSKALLLKGVEKPDGNTGRFIAPFIPLNSSATYLLSAWVWLEGGDDARFFMCSGEAKLEEGPMKSRSTNRISAKGEWQQVTWKIAGRGNLDLRLITLGKGAKAWVDDFSLIKQP